MQPGQVPPNQNFLNRPPGPIPVSHGNVQPQVYAFTLCWHVCLCFHISSPLTLLVVGTLTAWVPTDFLHALLVTLPAVSSFIFSYFHHSSPLFLFSGLSCVQSVVVGMPPVSQVSMMEEQQRQNNMVRPKVALNLHATRVQGVQKFIFLNGAPPLSIYSV